MYSTSQILLNGSQSFSLASLGAGPDAQRNFLPFPTNLLTALLDIYRQGFKIKLVSKQTAEYNTKYGTVQPKNEAKVYVLAWNFPNVVTHKKCQNMLPLVQNKMCHM